MCLALRCEKPSRTQGYLGSSSERGNSEPENDRNWFNVVVIYFLFGILFLGPPPGSTNSPRQYIIPQRSSGTPPLGLKYWRSDGERLKCSRRCSVPPLACYSYLIMFLGGILRNIIQGIKFRTLDKKKITRK